MRRALARFCVGGAFALLGCLSPAEERARLDSTVGEADGTLVSVRVTEGLAAVRELSEERLLLWASAPNLELSLDWHRAGALELELRNVVPGSELVQSAEGARFEALTLEPVDSGSSTRLRVRMNAAEPGVRQLQLRAPGGEVPRAFRIGLMSDVQEAIDEVADVFHRINAEPGLDFLLGAGDLTRRGSRAELARFEHELGTLEIPYYTTLGNHELGQSPPVYHAVFGRGSFSFEHQGVRFTLLDSASATLDPLVYEWFEAWAARALDRLHVVAMHIPPIDPVGVRNGSFASRDEAFKLFGRMKRAGVDLTLYGHIHSYYSFENGGIPARISGGGGAIPERFDQIGRHFLVIDFDPERERFESRVVRVDP